MRVINRSDKSGRQMEKLLGECLDDRFTLVHHVRLPDRKNAVDALLVGPHGVTVFAWAGGPGRVRCLGDNWYVWNLTVKDFVRGDHNPAKQAQSDRAAVEAFLAGRQMGSVVPVDCAVLAAQPSAQVEFMQPAATILPADKIAQFAGTLAGQRELLEWTQANDVLKSLGAQPQGQSWRALHQPGGRRPTGRSRGRSGGLQRWQIILLVVMAVVNLSVLIGGLLILLSPP